MMDFISIPLVVGIITLGFYKVIELFVCRKERLTMVEKIGATFDPSMIANKFSFPERGQAGFVTLKFACLLLGVGLGLLVGFFIAIGLKSTNMEITSYTEEIAYGASTLLFGGLGLLVAFLLEMKYSKKDKE